MVTYSILLKLEYPMGHHAMLGSQLDVAPVLIIISWWGAGYWRRLPISKTVKNKIK
jgi:hypothetical protein